MPLYTFRGMASSGREVKSTITAENEILAKQKIKMMGVMLLHLQEQTTGKKSTSSLSFFSGGISINELALMTRQLATLIKARIQIVEALNALVDQVESDALRVILSEVKTKVNEGSSLAKAMSEHPKAFNNVYVNMVEAGEASGTLDVVLLRLSDFTEAQVKLKNKIKGAMTYPIIMAIFGVGMINVIFIVVIPKIAKLFKSMKKELPLQTKISIAISDFLVDYWWFVIVIIGAVIFLFRRWIASPSGQKLWHAFLLKTPIFGGLIKMINVSRFTSTLSTLLTSGVPMLASISIVKNLIPNVLMRAAIEESRLSVSEGKSMTGPLIECGHFPPLVTHMIKLGEQSGELEDMLKIISENYEDQVESKISGLTSILEPIMMMGLGLAVGFIVFSVVVPMMQLNSVK